MIPISQYTYSGAGTTGQPIQETSTESPARFMGASTSTSTSTSSGMLVGQRPILTRSIEVTGEKTLSGSDAKAVFKKQFARLMGLLKNPDIAKPLAQRLFDAALIARGSWEAIIRDQEDATCLRCALELLDNMEYKPARLNTFMALLREVCPEHPGAGVIIQALAADIRQRPAGSTEATPMNLAGLVPTPGQITQKAAKDTLKSSSGSLYTFFAVLNNDTLKKITRELYDDGVIDSSMLGYIYDNPDIPIYYKSHQLTFAIVDHISPERLVRLLARLAAQDYCETGRSLAQWMTSKLCDTRQDRQSQ